MVPLLTTVVSRYLFEAVFYFNTFLLPDIYSYIHTYTHTHFTANYDDDDHHHHRRLHHYCMELPKLTPAISGNK
jgi:hypothetical protein